MGDLPRCELYTDSYNVHSAEKRVEKNELFCEKYQSYNENAFPLSVLWNSDGTCKNSDSCLQAYSGWSNYYCEQSSGYNGYCDKYYSKEMECCPLACGRCNRRG